MIERYTVDLPAIVQHPRDLALCVISGQFHDPLTVLAQRVVTLAPLERWRFDFRIIGESHWITVSRDGQPLLHEVLACIDIEAERCIRHHVFSDLQPQQFDLQFKHHRYRVNVSVDQVLSVPAYYDDALVATFPRTFGAEPHTQLCWQIADRTVHWWTLHTYPQAHADSDAAVTMTQVYSSSFFELTTNNSIGGLE